ncbi:MAG: hypothetical protein IID41_10885 [Planctomycetes bacterium]|nr:hypothetical protein [Planctomycetota bacterium]
MRRMTMVVPVMLVGLLAIAGGSDRPIEAGESIDQFATRCKPCVWEYSFQEVQVGEPIEAISGSGFLHGIWMNESSGRVRMWNGEPGVDQIGRFQNGSTISVFYELNIRFDDGLYFDVPPAHSGGALTLLYR